MGSAESKPEGFEENPYVKRILEARQNLTGWERLKFMFRRDEYGNTAPEFQRVITATTIGVVVGAFIGALGRGRIAYQDFFRSNIHEVFETPLQAKRKLQDTVTLGMGSGAYRIAWRMGLFTLIFMTTSTAVSVYRGKMGVIDQIAGAGTAGFIYKFAQGPKAAIAGGTIGCGLGLFSGLLSLGLTKITGQTIDSANLQYYHSLAVKDEKMKEYYQKQRENKLKYDRDIFAAEETANAEIAREHDKNLQFKDALASEYQNIKENERLETKKSNANASETSTTTAAVSSPSHVKSENSSSSSTESESVIKSTSSAKT